MSFTPMIIKRYLGSRRGFTRVVTAFSVLGILLGVAALIIVLAVMGGFRQELMTRILGVTGHATIEVTDLTLPAATQLSQRLRDMPEVESAQPYISAQAMISAQGRATGAYVRGLPAGELPEMITKNLILAEAQADVPDETSPQTIKRAGRTRGERTPKLSFSKGYAIKEGEVLLGAQLARQLGILPGQKVLLLSPNGARTIAGFIPRTMAFTVAGFFEVGMMQFDSGLAVAGIEDTQRFATMGNRVSAIEVKLKNPENARALKPQLYELAEKFAPTPLDLRVTTWEDTNADFFRALQVERVTMFIILSLIVLVAAFNIISGQMMLVNDKLSDIAILRTMGATKADVRRIFFYNGMLLGGMGTLGGVVLGAVAVWNMGELVEVIKHFTGVNLFPGDVYFLSELPGRLAWGDMAAVVGMAMLLTILASLYPAWKASNFNPVELLRR